MILSAEISDLQDRELTQLYNVTLPGRRVSLSWVADTSGVRP